MCKQTRDLFATLIWKCQSLAMTWWTSSCCVGWRTINRVSERAKNTTFRTEDYLMKTLTVVIVHYETRAIAWSISWIPAHMEDRADRVPFKPKKLKRIICCFETESAVLFENITLGHNLENPSRAQVVCYSKSISQMREIDNTAKHSWKNWPKWHQVRN